MPSRGLNPRDDFCVPRTFVASFQSFEIAKQAAHEDVILFVQLHELYELSGCGS